MMTLDHLRRYGVARSLFKPTTLKGALDRMGFVKADPIRAPARAQDLILRHRVRGYRAGDLERRYPRLTLEEGFFIKYGFLPSAPYRLMHPRALSGYPCHGARMSKHVRAVLDFIHERGAAHPREVDAHFDRG